MLASRERCYLSPWVTRLFSGLNLHESHYLLMLKLISNGIYALLNMVVLLSLAVLMSSCQPEIIQSDPSLNCPKPSVVVPHNHSYSNYIQARLLVADGEIELAHAALDRAIADDPDAVYLYSAKASLYLDHGKIDHAYSLLMVALSKSPDDVTSQLLLADLLHSRGSSDDVAQAMTLFHQVLRNNPDMDELYIHLARLHLKDNDFAQATVILNQYLQRHPHALMGLMEFARLHRLQGEWLLADEFYRKVIEHYPEHRRAYVLLGQLLEQRKQIDEALHVYQQGREATGDHFYFDHLISAFLMQYERNDEADVVLDRLLAINPLDADALSKRGLIYFEAEQWPQAETVFRLSVSQQPVSQLYYWLAYSLEQQHKWQQAVEFYQRVVEPVALHYQALERLSQVYAQLGEYDLAATTLETLLKQSGQGRLNAQPQAYLQLALFYHYQHQKKLVLEAIQWGIEQYPKNASLYFALGVYYQQYGELALMEKAMRHTITLQNDHAGALNHLAYTYAEAGKNLDEALAMSLKAVEVLTQQQGSADGATLDTLGWVYYQRGHYEQARTVLEQAGEKTPDDLHIQEHLADTYRALGLTPLAAEIYRAILQQAPQTESVAKKLKEIQP